MISVVQSIRSVSKARYLYSIILLATIAAVAYLTFYAPILYSDDWSIVLGRWYYGGWKWFDLTEIRPLLMARIAILYQIFGLNIHAFYAALWVLNVVTSVQLYLLMLRFLPKNASIALAFAAIVLVYPADFTHMWLIMLNIRTVGFLTLLYAHLLLFYADTGKRWALWASLVILSISFGMYEGQLGITMAWCLFVLLLKKPKSIAKWVTLSLPLVIGALFALWRSVGYLVLEIPVKNAYLNRLQLTPTLILERLLRGYRLMVWAWLDPLISAYGINRWQAIGFLLAAMALSCLLMYGIIQYFFKRKEPNLTYQQKTKQVKPFLLMAIIGPFFIAAGYVPAIAIFRPTLFPLHSRLNIFALMGATMIIVALVAIVVLRVSKSQQQFNSVVLAGLTPLIIFGIMVQAQVQYDDRLAWEEQQQIWKQLFVLAPNLKAGTNVFFFVPNSTERSPSLNRNERRTPFAGSWDVSTGLDMLYGRRDLEGDIITKELLLADGIKDQYNDKIRPYDHAIVTVYDGHLKQLRIVEDLQAEGLINFSIKEYTPYEHIIETPTTQTKFRWLVDVPPQKE